MKTLIVYYSLEGNTKSTAEKIAAALDADILQLSPVKAYPTGGFSKFFWGGKSASMGEKPKLEPYAFNLSDYDCIILGTPVWAGTFTPPLRTFLDENNLSDRKLALFACSSGGNATKCFAKLKKALHQESVLAELSLVDPFAKPSDENNRKIEDFCSKIKTSL